MRAGFQADSELVEEVLHLLDVHEIRDGSGVLAAGRAREDPGQVPAGRRGLSHVSCALVSVRGASSCRVERFGCHYPLTGVPESGAMTSSAGTGVLVSTGTGAAEQPATQPRSIETLSISRS